MPPSLYSCGVKAEEDGVTRDSNEHAAVLINSEYIEKCAPAPLVSSQRLGLLLRAFLQSPPHAQFLIFGPSKYYHKHHTSCCTGILKVALVQYLTDVVE